MGGMINLTLFSLLTAVISHYQGVFLLVFEQMGMQKIYLWYSPIHSLLLQLTQLWRLPLLRNPEMCKRSIITFNMFSIWIYIKKWCIPVTKAEFSVSHYPSDIILIWWFAAWILLCEENNFAASYFSENWYINFFFKIIFCNILNVFTVKFDHFHSSFLN